RMERTLPCSSIVAEVGVADGTLSRPPPIVWIGVGCPGRGRKSKSECHFLNGTQRVRLLLRSFYDRQEIDYIDSDLGKYVAVTPLGQPDVDKWNKDEVYLQYWKAQVDSVCRHNYQLYKFWSFLPGPQHRPTVTISPTKMDPASPNTILLCTARGFYPLEIEVRWLKNGQLEEEGVSFGEEFQNGDWTYQLQVILETQPQQGDVYTCQVEHASLEAPITVQWEPRSSSSAKKKLWIGIMGAVIGVAFLAVGLFSYLKSKKGESGGLEERLWGGKHPGEGFHQAQQVTKRVSLRNIFGKFCSWRGY
uniref:Ig-like domain-containing protein n=1 Tax=Naja naja TaxID=35670 RepID=A0A8C6X141_NAJNA